MIKKMILNCDDEMNKSNNIENLSDTSLVLKNLKLKNKNRLVLGI